MTIAAALPKQSTTGLVKRLAGKYVRPYTVTLIVALLFMAVASAMTAVVALLMDPVLEDVLGAKNTSLIVPIGLAIFVTFAVRGIATYISTIMMGKAGHAMIADIQRDLFAHLMTLDLAFFHANPSGQLISRVINDVRVVRMALADSLMGVGRNFLTLLFLGGVMLYKDPKLTLAALFLLPFAAGFVAYIGQRLRQISKMIQDEFAHLSDKLSQTFQGIRQVQAYSMEDQEITDLVSIMAQLGKLPIFSLNSLQEFIN